ncbi:HAMP domain-containing histidine kinase [Sphingobacterium sp. DN00404]|uniref:histidine kinase n=1 Tax=Sphingobacterium micropteri TaxID=2763501 RepID=A0ABR7YJ95_9SPHI|nr:HAMP domain-containing sensor histidine kinase [Sphingobacterium micropteri]MBD1431393.1 HAMP domain-containing histidine kinase [Sphingobacterium micropteri]
MQVSLKNYTLRYLSIAFLVIITIWAALFYAFILEEVYDNVDDGLKNQKILILREVYEDPNLLETNEYGINQFRITPVGDDDDFSEENYLDNEFFYMPYDDEMEPYRVLRTGFYAPNQKPYHLEIRTSTVEEDDLILNLTTALLVLYLVLVLGVYLINESALRRAWRPFRIILENLNLYRFGKKDYLKPVSTNIMEFNQLDEEIHRMWRRNEEVFDEQKRFIENAAHELQTPLAITINKLEMLMEDDSLSEDQLTQLAESKSSLRRLVNLNKALLMLSRIENKQYKDVKQLNLNQLVKEISADFQDFLSFKDITLQLKENGIFDISMNKDLALVLISNLFRNAIRYNINGGIITVHIQHNQLSITNTGNQVSLDQEKIFNRFHKGTQDSQSNGLGLAIVKSIVDTYPELSINYRFEDNRHVFSLKK